MTREELLSKVKENLKLEDDSKDLIISDAIQEVINYCNLKEPPAELEPFIRKKAQGIMNYEKENGTESVFDVKSIKEGDTSISYFVDKDFSKEAVYGLSKNDKKSLQAFRRLRK